MIFLPHTNTVILLEPYCGTITEPGLPVVNTKFEIAITGTIIENPSFYSDIRRFGWSSYTSVVVINVWLCRLTGYVLRRRKK